MDSPTTALVESIVLKELRRVKPYPDHPRIRTMPDHSRSHLFKKISLFFYGGVVKNPARQSLYIADLIPI